MYIPQTVLLRNLCEDIYEQMRRVQTAPCEGDIASF